MLYRCKLSLYLSVLVISYFLLVHLQCLEKLNNDFSSFYSAALNYLQHASPYQALNSDFLLKPISLAVNANPPFFVCLISPLTYLGYAKASLLWAMASLFFGAWGSLLCFYLASEPDFFKHNYLNFLLIYLASYACLMNSSLNQVAGFLFFLIMQGYYFFQKKKDYCCALFWGLAVALKLFPGLLFLFVLANRRYRVFSSMLLIFLLSWSLPLVTHGSEVYRQYFANIHEILWYGNTWNASLLAYLFRLFIDMEQPSTLWLINLIYQISFISLVLWYGKKLLQLNSHYGFCLSLIMMLVLSPLGWMYYFALIIPSLILIYQAYQQEEEKGKNIYSWFLVLFFINMPLQNLQARELSTELAKLSYGSLYFYGLLLTGYLLLQTTHRHPKPPRLSSSNKCIYTQALEFTLAFSVFVVLFSLIK